MGTRSIYPVVGVVMCCLLTALSGVCAGDGAALQFNGTSNRVDIATALVSDDITMSAWVKASTPWVNDTRVPVSNSYWGAAASRVGFHIMLQANGTAASRYQTQADGVGVWSVTGTTNVTGDWHHLAYVKEGTKIAIVVDGKEEASRTDMPASIAGLAVSNQIRIGCNTSNARFVPGIIDEVRIWNFARSLAEIEESMGHELRGTEEGLVGYWNFNEGQGTTVFDGTSGAHDGTIVGATWTTDAAPVASGPVPPSAHGAAPAADSIDVPRDVVLSWQPGGYADTHDVYLGTAFADVDAASRTDPKGTLTSQGQDANTYDPADALEFGTTYYWRVDEVNAPPSDTIIKGPVWSFTVEPYAYPVTPVKATASSAQAGMEPENAINGSGLNASDQHSATGTEMWLSSGAQPNWIQFEFDAPCKLHELWVWNSNQLIEPFIGFGAKEVAIEYSLDGSTWTTLEGVPEFARATGLTTYAHDTVVDLGGIFAQYVRLTIVSAWGTLPQAGLSEVRFFSAPVRAREPMPAVAATDVSIDTVLDWRPGREAQSHDLFLGAAPDALVLTDTLTDHGYTPGSLDFGTTYYWKVDEVGETDVYAGDVWSFTTREYAIVEDMESYNDDDNRIYDTWIDGLTTGASGSQVGYDVAPFAEKALVHGGKQSMPLKYDNSLSPFVSEAEREFATAQNWALNGADTLSVWVQGSPGAFMEDAGTITMSAAGHDIWDNADDFRFAYKTLTGDGSIMVKVESIVNTNVWAKAGVMIRQSLDADSKFVYMVQSYGSGVSLGNRALTAGAAASVPATAGIAAPQWVKLTRKGEVFTAQYSPDGTTWTDLKAADGTIGTATVAMTNPVYIGLCVTSHNAAATTTAVMSDVKTTGNVTGGSWEVLAIGDDPQPANAPADLYVTIQDSAGKSATATHPTAVTTAAWTEWQIPLSSFTGVNMTRVKNLTIGVDSRNSAIKGAGLIYVDDIGYGHPATME